MRKAFKKILSGVLSFAIVAAGLTVTTAKSQAARTSEAYMMFSSEGNTYTYWHDGKDDSLIEVQTAKITGAGQYTVGMDFTKLPDGYCNKIQFVDFEVEDGEKLFPGYCFRLDNLKINGEDVKFEQGYTTSDNGSDTRMNIVNPWASVNDNPSARSFDKKLTNKKVSLIDPDKWDKLKTIEVTFTYAKNMPEKAGAFISESGFKYKVTGMDTVELTGVKFNTKLTSIGKNAFKGAKTVKVTGKEVTANKKLVKKSGAKVK